MSLSVADAQIYLGVSGTDDVTEITAFIAAALAAMEEFLARKIASTAVTETVDGPGRDSLWLREPAETITTIHVDANRAWGAGALISASDYALKTLRDGTGRNVIYLDNIWCVGRQNIRIIYNAGWTTTPGGILLAWMPDKD